LSAEYIVAPAALDDIDDIAAWMREKNPGSDFDLQFIDEVYEAFAFLAERPGGGHKRQDITDLPVMFWTVMKSFAVIYRSGPPVQMVRVSRWTRDITAILIDEGDLARL
jgi:plasmid stabilization system protein ParE